MTEPANLRETIEQAIHEVLAGSGRAPKAICPEHALSAEIGLDSLDVAQVVVLLEQRLGVDPFRVGGRSIRTFGDLHLAYRKMFEASA
jgi:acyl carrier protein